MDDDYEGGACGSCGGTIEPRELTIDPAKPGEDRTEIVYFQARQYLTDRLRIPPELLQKTEKKEGGGDVRR